MDVLHKLTEFLLEKETVTGSELDDLIRAMRPGIEFPAKINAKSKHYVF
jgi:cell division protease FtsH